MGNVIDFELKWEEKNLMFDEYISVCTNCCHSFNDMIPEGMIKNQFECPECGYFTAGVVEDELFPYYFEDVE
jgi:predicted RNA-binding Zn-ribbon protein involved in translation (DUF1610 family)